LPGILFVHGFRAHAHWWDHIAPSFADRHRVVALSLSGMGDSDSRDEYERGQFGRDMIGVAQACGFDPAILITHSFGTLGALRAISEAPDRFSRLIMIDAGLPIEGAPEHVMAEPPRRVYPSREAALERFRLLPESPAPEPLVRAYIGNHSVRQDVDGWTWKFDPHLPASINRQPYWRVNVEELSLPVDIILGDMTSIMTPPRVAAAQKLAPHAGAPILIPASEHHVMIDQPIALVAALRGLLANPPQDTGRRGI
jgi:pimeloyl-ACP methyl ester carboxylesterase